MVSRARDEMKRMLQSDWLAERERWVCRARFLSRKNKCLLGQLMNSLLTRMALISILIFDFFSQKRTWPITVLLILLNPRAGKMKRILRSDWLPTLVPQENFTFWRCETSSFSLFLVHTDLDFFSANKIATKNLSNIERSLPSLLCFTLYLRAISKYKPPGAYIWRDDLTEGFLRYEFGGWWGLILGGAYTWKSLFSEFYGILHYEWRTFYLMVFNTD